MPHQQETASQQLAADVTTLMFRYIPRKFSAKDLVAELSRRMPKRVLDGKFDFVYVPWDRFATSNMGYAFVNFTDHWTAQKVFATIDGTIWQNDRRRRHTVIVPAKVQGVVDNLRRYSEMNSEPDLTHCPLVFLQGKETPLATAIAVLCPPIESTCPSSRSSSPAAHDDVRHQGPAPEDVPISPLFASLCFRPPPGLPAPWESPEKVKFNMDDCGSDRSSYHDQSLVSTATSSPAFSCSGAARVPPKVSLPASTQASGWLQASEVSATQSVFGSTGYQTSHQAMSRLLGSQITRDRQLQDLTYGTQVEDQRSFLNMQGFEPCMHF